MFIFIKLFTVSSFTRKTYLNSCVPLFPAGPTGPRDPGDPGFPSFPTGTFV